MLWFYDIFNGTIAFHMLDLVERNYLHVFSLKYEERLLQFTNLKLIVKKLHSNKTRSKLRNFTNLKLMLAVNRPF